MQNICKSNKFNAHFFNIFLFERQYKNPQTAVEVISDISTKLFYFSFSTTWKLLKIIHEYLFNLGL